MNKPLGPPETEPLAQYKSAICKLIDCKIKNELAFYFF